MPTQSGPGVAPESHVEQATTDTTNVLVVDDNPDVRTMVTDFLELLGCIVRIAANGREALDRLSEFRPDLILLDLMMPVMDGRTFATHVRGQPWGGSLRIVVMSAAPAAEQVCREINALGCLSKPFDLDVLAHLVERSRGW